MAEGDDEHIAKRNHSEGMQLCLQLLTPSADLQLHLNLPPLTITFYSSSSLPLPPISLPVIPEGEGTQLPCAHTGPD